jgi:hypothetical protein
MGGAMDSSARESSIKRHSTGAEGTLATRES